MLRELREALEGAPEVEWPDPEPIREEPLPEWIEGTLPPEMEEYALEVANRLCVDPTAVCMTFLVAATGAMVGRAWIAPDPLNPTWKEPTALWLAVVAPSGMSKTPIMKAALGPLEEIEEELHRRNQEEQENYELELERWSAERKGGRGPRPKPPTKRTLLVQDITKEALGERLSQNPGLLAFHDELRGLFATWLREDRAAERAFYVSAYSAAPIKVDRMSRETLFVARPVLSLLGFIQPGPLGVIIREAQKIDSPGADGLLQRFMMVMVREIPWKEERPAISGEAQRRYSQLIHRIYEKLRFGPELVLPFSPDAQSVWYDFESQTEIEKRHPDITDAWRGLISKRKGLAARLALVLSLLWEEEGPISDGVLLRAIAITELVEEHARRLWTGGILGYSESVVKWAQRLKSGEIESFTARELYRRNFAGIATPEEARRVIQILLEANWIAPDPSNPRRYLVNPKVKQSVS